MVYEILFCKSMILSLKRKKEKKHIRHFHTVSKHPQQLDMHVPKWMQQKLGIETINQTQNEIDKLKRFGQAMMYSPLSNNTKTIDN